MTDEEIPTIYTWKGKPIHALDKPQLMEVIYFLLEEQKPEDFLLMQRDRDIHKRFANLEKIISQVREEGIRSRGAFENRQHIKRIYLIIMAIGIVMTINGVIDLIRWMK